MLKEVVWDDWSDAVQVRREERDGMAEDAIRQMSRNKDWPYLMISTGDTTIIATREFDGTIEIRDCKTQRVCHHAA